jgi:hypothetical protein
MFEGCVPLNFFPSSNPPLPKQVVFPIIELLENPPAKSLFVAHPTKKYMFDGEKGATIRTSTNFGTIPLPASLLKLSAVEVAC